MAPANLSTATVPSLSLNTSDSRRHKTYGYAPARVPEVIIKKISYDGRTEYLVKWAGLPNSCNTWECPSKTPSISPLIAAMENPSALTDAGAGSCNAHGSCTPASSKAGSTSTLDDRFTPASSLGGAESAGSVGTDFAGLDVSGNAAVQALACMMSARTPSPADYNSVVPDWSSMLLNSADAGAAKGFKQRSLKPPRPAALTADGRPKVRRRSSAHGSSLHDVGTRVILATEKGEHDGAAGFVSRVPVHPSTWYEVTLTQSGQVLKLRSSSFRVVDGDSPTSPEKRPLELDVALAQQAHVKPAHSNNTAQPQQHKKPRMPKTALPELGQQVIITGDKGGRQGQRGTISRTPDHPSTWYELTLNDGEVLKLRSTSFTTNMDWTSSDDDDTPKSADPVKPPPSFIHHAYQRLKDEDAMSDSEAGEEEEEAEDELEGTPCA